MRVLRQYMNAMQTHSQSLVYTHTTPRRRRPRSECWYRRRRRRRQYAHTYTHMYPRILYAYAHKDTRAGRAIYNLLIAYSTAHHLRIDYTYCVCTTTGFRFVCVCVFRAFTQCVSVLPLFQMSRQTTTQCSTQHNTYFIICAKCISYLICYTRTQISSISECPITISLTHASTRTHNQYQ